MSIVLLNPDGTLYRSLSFINLPNDYVVPEGKTVSWRFLHDVNWRRSSTAGSQLEPVEATFFYKNAVAMISRGNVQGYENHPDTGARIYGTRTLTITVQGAVLGEVHSLREKILEVISSGQDWQAINRLDPELK